MKGPLRTSARNGVRAADRVGEMQPERLAARVQAARHRQDRRHPDATGKQHHRRRALLQRKGVPRRTDAQGRPLCHAAVHRPRAAAPRFLAQDRNDITIRLPLVVQQRILPQLAAEFARIAGLFQDIDLEGQSVVARDHVIGRDIRGRPAKGIAVQEGHMGDVVVILDPAPGGSLDLVGGNADHRARAVLDLRPARHLGPRLVGQADPDQAIAFAALEGARPQLLRNGRTLGQRRDADAGALAVVFEAVKAADQQPVADRAKAQLAAPVHADILGGLHAIAGAEQHHRHVQKMHPHRRIGHLAAGGDRVPEPGKDYPIRTREAAMKRQVVLRLGVLG